MYSNSVILKILKILRDNYIIIVIIFVFNETVYSISLYRNIDIGT